MNVNTIPAATTNTRKAPIDIIAMRPEHKSTPPTMQVPSRRLPFRRNQWRPSVTEQSHQPVQAGGACGCWPNPVISAMRGRKSAITMLPTMMARNTISNGSIREVKAATALSTSSS